MNQKTLCVGQKAFRYSFSKNHEEETYMISMYNMQLHSLSYYQFKISEIWVMRGEDPYSTFVITIYHVNPNTHQILSNGSWKVAYAEQEEERHNISRLGQNYNIPYIEVSYITMEIKQDVSLPNISTLGLLCKDTLIHNSTIANYYVVILTELTTQTKYMELVQSDTVNIQTNLTLQSRKNYQCKVYKVNLQNGNQYKVIYKYGTNFLSHNFQSDVRRLMNLAENHVSFSSKIRIEHLYRNKPDTHPTILSAKRTGVMEKYIKDNNGDPASSINGNIHGLFFMATPDYRTDQIPQYSYFGNYRIMVPPQYLADGCNLYFADFTCLQGKSHYVTLVLCKQGSDEDRYCQNRLVKLDMKDNPFFSQSYLNSFSVPSKLYLHVEILYTENVNLLEMAGVPGFRQYVLRSHQVRGLGQSRADGIRKPSSCNVCNLPRAHIN